MTDLPANLASVPGRLGATGLVDQRGLVIEIEPQRELLHHGVLRASVITFAVDVVAGVTLDTDPEAWTFTTDLTLRMRPVSAPTKVTATGTVLRQGRRSAHFHVEVVDDEGGEVAVGAIGFAHVPRRPGDPPKPIVSPEDVAARFSNRDRIARPLREEAEIVAIDPGAGVVELAVRPEVCNPAGTIQGAMVALVAEAATEDLLGSTGQPVVVTDLDLRYLGQATVGPVRSRCRLLGGSVESCPPVEVQLVDLATDRVTTLAYTRAVPVSK
ncbi:MAG: hotdog domain-containing protein [Acidimicrobiales bacterium]